MAVSILNMDYTTIPGSLMSPNVAGRELPFSLTHGSLGETHQHGNQPLPLDVSTGERLCFQILELFPLFGIHSPSAAGVNANKLMKYYRS